MEAIFFLLDIIVLYLILLWSLRADFQPPGETPKGVFGYKDNPDEPTVTARVSTRRTPGKRGKDGS